MSKALAAHLGLFAANLLHIVEEFEEHDPGEHWETIEIAVEPFVLPHDVAAGSADGRRPLRGGEGLLRFHFSHSSSLPL